MNEGRTCGIVIHGLNIIEEEPMFLQVGVSVPLVAGEGDDCDTGIGSYKGLRTLGIVNGAMVR